jgi:hypothetical protein
MLPVRQGTFQTVSTSMIRYPNLISTFMMSRAWNTVRRANYLLPEPYPLAERRQEEAALRVKEHPQAEARVEGSHVFYQTGNKVTVYLTLLFWGNMEHYTDFRYIRYVCCRRYYMEHVIQSCKYVF